MSWIKEEHAGRLAQGGMALLREPRDTPNGQQDVDNQSDAENDIRNRSHVDVENMSYEKTCAIVPLMRARKRPRPAWSNGMPRPLRAVAGASIAPPPNLREMVEIVPPHRRAAHAYLFRPATPTVRA